MNSLIFFAEVFIAGFGALGLAYYLNGYGMGKLFPGAKDSSSKMLGFIHPKKATSAQRQKLLVFSLLCLVFGIWAVMMVK